MNEKEEIVSLPRRSPSSWREREPRRRPRSFRSFSRPSDRPMKPCPVEEGGEYDVSIESIGSKGDGIAKIQGFIIFVPGVNVGDHVKVRITTVRRNFAIAELVGAGEAAAPIAPEALPEEEEAAEVSETSAEEAED